MYLQQERGGIVTSLFSNLTKPVSERCIFCPLNSSPICVNPVDVVGSGEVLFVGLAPAAAEVQSGRPFVGQSGQLLRQELASLNCTNYALTNMVWCEIKDEGVLRRAATYCVHHLLQVVRMLQPKKVVLLGEATVEVERAVRELGVPVLRVTHPAAVLYNRGLLPQFRQQLRDAVAGRVVVGGQVRWRLVSPDETKVVAAWLKRVSCVVFDFEVDLLNGVLFDPANPVVCVALAFPDASEVFVLPTKEWGVDAYRSLLRELARSPATKVAHNILFDMVYLFWAAEGVLLRPPIADTLLMSYVLSENSHDRSLKALARQYFGVDSWDEQVAPYLRRGNLGAAPTHLVYAYCAQDAYWTLKLYFRLQSQLDRDPGLRRLLRDLLYPLCWVYAIATIKGIKVDLEWLEQVGQRLRTVSEQLLEELRSYAAMLGVPDFNPSSVPQLRTLLYERLRLPVLGYTAKGQPSTNEETLRQLQTQHPHPLIDKILYYRDIQKHLATYVDGVREEVGSDGRVRPAWRLHGTVTGRITCTDPPIQTLPRSGELAMLVRGIFVPDSGYVFIEADFATHELRVAAALARDDRAREIFLAGRDIHSEVAAAIFGKEVAAVTSEERQIAKSIAFGLLYGMSVHTLASNFGISVEAAQAFVDRYFALFPKVRQWQAELLAQARRSGVVVLPTGRKRRLPDINSPDAARRGHSEREAINSPVQGYASDLCQLVALELVRRFVNHDKAAIPTTACLLWTVHDSLMVMVREGFEGWVLDLLCEVLSKVERDQDLYVPLAMEWGIHRGRWGLASKQSLIRDGINEQKSRD